MKRKNIVKKLEGEDMRDKRELLNKLNEEKETINYCPGCNVAHCKGRYTTGQCE